MNRLFIAFLLVSLCLVTACSNQSVATPTDTALLSSAVSPLKEENQVIQPVDEEQGQVKQTDSKTTQSGKKEEPKPTEKVEPEKTAKPDKQTTKVEKSEQLENAEQPAAPNPSEIPPNGQGVDNSITIDKQKEWPTFTTVTAFENWLAKGGEHQDVHDSMTQHVTNAVDLKAGYYYRPVFRSQNDFIKFKDIEFCSNKDLTYIYYRYDIIETINDNVDLQIWVDLEPYALDIDSGNLIKQLKYPENQRSFDDYSITTYNGIKYYVFYYSDSNHSYIYWGQYNKVFCADMNGYFNQLDQILPLLQVERVSYKANDHVTQ